MVPRLKRNQAQQKLSQLINWEILIEGQSIIDKKASREEANHQKMAVIQGVRRTRKSLRVLNVGLSIQTRVNVLLKVKHGANADK